MANTVGKIIGLTDEELDNQRCPKCNSVYDFETKITRNIEGCNYRFRVFERHKHICKKTKLIMEISNEIKGKVFAQYLGHNISYGHTLTGKIISDIEHGLLRDDIKLIIKPLSSITDEDAIEASAVIGGASHLSKESQIKQLRDLFSSPNFWVNQTNISGYKWFNCCQFLQSKGYDLPNYLLGGKTLHECNLAIF